MSDTNKNEEILESKSLEVNKRYQADLYLDSTLLLLPRDIPTPEFLPKILQEWKLDKITAVMQEASAIGVEESATRTIYKTVKNPLPQHDIAHEVNTSQKTYKMYTELLKTLKIIFHNLQYEKTFSKAHLFEIVHKLISTMKQYKSHMLRFQVYTTFTTLPDYWIEHSLRTTCMVIEYALITRMPYYRIVDITTASLLHVLGIFRLPIKSYTSDAPTVQEEKMIHAAPIITYRMLQTLDFSMSICEIVLQVKENIDGSGYPQKLKDEAISLGSKIIAICSKYQELISDVLPSNTAPLNNQSAIQALFKQADKQLDGAIVRQVIKSLTIFPAGSMVKLSSGNLALVINANPENPYKSVVRVLTTRNNTEKPIGNTILLDLEQEDISIAQEISYSQSKPLYKVLHKELADA